MAGDDELVEIKIRLKDARKFIGDADGSARAVKGIGNQADVAGKKMERAGRRSKIASAGFGALRSAAKFGAVALGAVVVAAGVHMTKSFAEAQAVTAKVHASIKATGGVANVTAKEVDALSTSISRKTGFDDEALSSAQANLLTFKKVRNEVGKNGNIYSRATKAIADMSIITGDLESNTVKVGKALNDPAKGAMALGKSGAIAKSDLEKLQKMAKAGVPVWKQQEFILGALEGQYKGQAEAYGRTLPGALAKFKVELGNVSETLGGKFGGHLAKGLNALTGFLGEIQSGTGKGNKFLTQMRGVGKWFKGVWKDLEPARAALAKFAKFLGPRMIAGAKKVVGYYRDEVLPILRGVFSDLSKTLDKWSKWGSKLWDKHGAKITATVDKYFRPLMTIITYPIRQAMTLVRVILAVLRGDWDAAGKHLVTMAKNTWDMIKARVKLGVAIVKTIVKGLGKVLGALMSGAWNLAKKAASAGWNKIVEGVRALPGKIRSLGGKMYDAAKHIGSKAKKGLLEMFGGGADFVKDMSKEFANYVIDILNKAIPNKIPLPGMKDIDLPNNPIDKFADGGRFSRGSMGRGSWITGEAGPELNRFDGSRVSVTPLTGPRASNPWSDRPDSGGGLDELLSHITGADGGGAPIVVQLVVDGRVLHQAVARDVKRKVARR